MWCKYSVAKPQAVNNTPRLGSALINYSPARLWDRVLSAVNPTKTIDLAGEALHYMCLNVLWGNSGFVSEAFPPFSFHFYGSAEDVLCELWL